jgi:hypothetical protein
VPVEGERPTLFRLDALKDHDDAQKVYSLAISDEVMARLSS